MHLSGLHQVKGIISNRNGVEIYSMLTTAFPEVGHVIEAMGVDALQVWITAYISSERFNTDQILQYFIRIQVTDIKIWVYVLRHAAKENP
ncbi:hypothetical protein D9M68_803030 [compost metagenome]